jgi:GNAT superfamily N-acetyltransferase
MIVKRKGKYCLLSKKTERNLGCYPTRAGAQQREREVQFFKRAGRRPIFVRRHTRRRNTASLSFVPTKDQDWIEGTQDVYLGQIPVAQYRYLPMEEPTSVLIAWVGVRADYRGLGYGRLVVEKILDDLLSQGIRHVYLFSLEDSRGFWKKMGFQEDPEQRGQMVMHLG